MSFNLKRYQIGLIGKILRYLVNQLVHIIIKERKKVDMKNHLIIIHKILKQFLKENYMKKITRLILNLKHQIYAPL